MASKKNTRKRTTKPTNQKISRAQQRKIQEEKASLKKEVLILSSLAICVLLLISNFGIGGFVGDALSKFLFGVFGWIAYIIPILIFVGIAFVVSNKGNSVAYIKTAACVVLVIMICMLFELVINEGGVLGRFFVSLLHPAIGLIGTYVITIILSIICLVVITEKSFLGVVKKESEKAYAIAKEDIRKRKELAEEQSQDHLPRRDRKVSGVSFNTTIEKKSSDVHEITPQKDIPDAFADGEQLVIDRAILEGQAEQETTDEKSSVSRRKTKESQKQVETETENVEIEIKRSEEKPKVAYQFPPLSLLTRGGKAGGDSNAYLRQTALKLQQTLQNFNVKVTVTNVSCGPTVTRYELQPEQGVKVSKIVGLADDIKLNLAASDIRIEAPIPGKAAVGIEVPNQENTAVMLRDLLESEEFKNHDSKIAFAVGRDIGGKVVVADIMKMPHVLIAGATGSGKSVCINTLIMSILYKASPEEVKLIMIDPKVVELSVYNGIPHLLIPVVTDPKKASGALNWAVAEMTKRYQLFAECNVRDIKGYNAKIESIAHIEEEGKPEKMPQIVIVVDELADLMMVAPGEVEGAVCRLAQLARAAGIHLVLATQRPSVDVITGLIKANMPSRIAFAVSSGVDSRTIIDMNGAEKLLGKGDMLFYPAGYPKPARVQGSFVSDKEVQAVVDFLVNHNGTTQYSEEITNHMNSASSGVSGGVSGGNAADERDAYFVEAGRFIIDKDKASIGMLQRVFKIGFNRAARIMDQLAEAGVVGEEEGTKPRKVLMSMEEFEAYIEEYV